jgi:DNA-binding transcriptional regulator GbsR (MarR family)
MIRMATLTPAMKKFVVHWGEMGTKWGINRTVAQIHALLYILPEPLTAEEIIELLQVARSNASTSLRELEMWGLIKVVHTLGDRKEKYECLKDVWEMFRLILEERKKREIDPTLKVLRDCVEDMKQAKDEPKYSRERIGEFLNFFEMMTDCYEQTKTWPVEKVMGLVKLKRTIKNALKR